MCQSTLNVSLLVPQEASGSHLKVCRPAGVRSVADFLPIAHSRETLDRRSEYRSGFTLPSQLSSAIFVAVVAGCAADGVLACNDNALWAEGCKANQLFIPLAWRAPHVLMRHANCVRW